MMFHRHSIAAGLLLSFCLATSAAFAQGPPSRAASPEVLKKTLPNGLQVIVVCDRLAPVVTTVMNYRVGADDEPITGLAHAQEHMMFRGSRTISASEFSDATSITGGEFNADTQNEVTQYYFTMPSQYLGIALHLEASRSQGILNSQKLWEAEREAMQQEVTGDISDADYRLYVKELHAVLAGTPYANEGLGTLESLGKQIQAPQLQQLYAQWYHPNNALLVIAGDVHPEQVMAEVEEAFGSIPAAPLPPRRQSSLQPLKPAVFREKSDKGYVLANIAFRFPGYSDPDYAAGQVLLDVLNNHRGQLYGLVASGKALAASVQDETFPLAGIALAEVSLPSTARPEAAESLLRKTLEDYRQRGVPADLVEAAKLRTLADDEQKGNSIQGLAMEWSQAVAVEGRSSPQDDFEAIQKVTIEDVNRVLRRYVVLSSAVVGYSVPGNQGEVSTGGARRKEEDHSVVPTEHRPLPDFANKVLSHLEVPAQTLHPTDTRLPNGLRLIVQPETITHSVLLQGTIRASTGLQTPPHQEGVDSLTETLLPYGTASYDRLTYQAELDKIAATVETGTRFSLNVLSGSFDRGAQLLADDLLHPAFPQADFDTVKQQILDEVVGEETEPSHLASVATARLLYPAGDPAQRFPTPSSVRSLTLEEVRAYYRSVYRPDMTTIVVVGDVTPEAARKTVERYFSDWKATGPRPVVDPSPVPDNRPGSFTVPDTGRVQDEVTLSQTVPLTRKDPDYAPLRVANAVLSGGFYSSLLFHELREVKGYVYSVESSFGFGRTRSEFTIGFGAMPENVDKAEAATIAQLKNLQRAPLPTERLLRAKAFLLGELPVMTQSYSGVASLLAAYAEADLPLDQNEINARQFLAVTAEQVQAALNRWVRPDGFVRGVEGPSPR